MTRQTDVMADPVRIKVDFVGASQSDDPTDWIQQAEQFLDAGAHLLRGTSIHLLPAIVHLGYAVELALKALLLEKKVADLEMLRRLGHQLPMIRRKAIDAGLPEALLTAVDAEKLAALFDDLPGVQGKGKLRAGIYPATSKLMHIEVSGDLLEIIAELVQHCATEVCGPRNREHEEAERKRLRVFLGGKDPGQVIHRSKPLPPG